MVINIFWSTNNFMDYMPCPMVQKVRYFIVFLRFFLKFCFFLNSETVIFNEICWNFLMDPKTIRIFDHNSKVPYAYRSMEWITYDDMESVTIKAQWINDQKDLGGSITFALNYDDYSGRCSFQNQSKFPLQNILYDILQN